MKTFNVQFYYPATAVYTYTVEAATKEEAEETAIELLGETDPSEFNVETEVDYEYVGIFEKR